MTLGIAIMHAAFDRTRVEELHKITDHLTPGYEVVQDHDRDGVWETARRCLIWGRDSGHSHLLILQDDLKLCRNFELAVDKIVEAVPGEMISLFYGKRKGFDPFFRWNLAEGPWGQAVIYPTHLIADLLEWVALNIHHQFNSYDARVALWCIAARRKCWVSMPSLVDHRGDMKSAMGHVGKREGPFYIGDDKDPLELDWTDVGVYADGSRSLAQYNKWFL